MSALENILDRCGLEEVDTFMGPSAFRHVARRVRALLTEMGAPVGMAGKVPELNRRTLGEKVMTLLRACRIVVDDMPENWLATVHGDHRRRQGRSPRRAEPTIPRNWKTRRSVRIHPGVSRGGHAIPVTSRKPKSP
ncbi:hypothetical protein [Allomesorhizobium camelthorni]|uniref:Uncharacterized protein n=1 Tax=Allomesorhizobium camelthorni TaxID=475069 RepID=A0A6G4WAC5_9HYPH|nr:hypothetical protein [Mesorhizobium camelthorni]NGO51077.1 hypothetical protein [Mesorhizobium camelthorni]